MPYNTLLFLRTIGYHVELRIRLAPNPNLPTDDLTRDHRVKPVTFNLIIIMEANC